MPANIREFLGHPVGVGGGDVAAVPRGLFARDFQGQPFSRSNLLMANPDLDTRWMTRSDESWYTGILIFEHAAFQHPNACPAAIHSFLDLGFDYAFAFASLARGHFLQNLLLQLRGSPRLL